MKKRNFKKALLASALSVGLALGQLTACSDEANDTPGQSTVVTGGSTGVGGSTGQGANGSGNDTGSGGENNGGNSTGSGGENNNGSGGEGGSNIPDNDCDPELTDDECWSCPEQTEHFINQCNSAQCEPFVNDKARLPLLNDDGSLPEIP
jgi:hypothetical protein